MESKPGVQPFAPQSQRRERIKSREPLPASSLPLTLPNPHVSEQSSRGNSATWTPRQRPATTDGAWLERGDTTGKHGYRNNRHARGTPEDTANAPRERSIRDKQTKMSKYSTDSPSQYRSTGRRSQEIPKRDVRGARSAPNTSNGHRSAQPTFEVKMADFPELHVLPGIQAIPVHQRSWWGSPSEAPKPQSLKPEPTVHQIQAARKGQSPDPSERVSDIKPASSVTKPGPTTEAVSQTSGCAPAVVTSWANVASQPPKKPAPKEKTPAVTTTSKEGTAGQPAEGAAERKKRRNKKKKTKDGNKDVDAEEPVVHQEPPKFEDEEEFPGLDRRVLKNNNTVKLCNEESLKEAVLSQPSDQNKDKDSAAQPPPVEATKKEQKPEKVSGKKSKAPVQLDFGNMLAVLEKKQQSQKSKQDAKPVVLSVGGGLPVGQKQPAAQKKLPWQPDKIAHNPLDSTSPLVKKGKQREVPKAKKPTPLKRIILKEREERKQNRLLEERGLPPRGEQQPDTDTVAEEQSEATNTDHDGSVSPTMGLENQPEVHEASETEGEGEERDKEEAEEQKTTEAPPCPLNRPKIHSRKFRDYCSQVLSKDVDECVTNLLKELVRFQDRLYQKDPIKARMRRRLVMGLREVLKHLKLRKVKCVVISPNCERIQAKGGLDEALHTIIDTCREQGVPFVFALSRKALGRCVNKAVPVSLVGIFNYDGAQDFYHKMIELSAEARTAYEVMVANLELAQQTEIEQEILEPQPSPQPAAEEPEFITLWKTVLKKECNHKFLNFEEQLASMELAGECTEEAD